MKLSEALQLVQKHSRDAGEPLRVFLACGFTPLHLETFLTAHLLARSEGPVQVESGLYGDAIGSLERTEPDGPRHVVVVIEWSDLDPRLGYRSSHGWRPQHAADVANTVSQRLDQLLAVVQTVAQRGRVCVSLPTLPLPPIFSGPPRRGDALGFALLEATHRFASALAAMPMVSVLNPQHLEKISPPAARHDARLHLSSDFPYRLSHASLLAAELAQLVLPDAPKKGIITDLDNVLWSGILGEDGVDGVTWDLDHHSFAHALYQEMLTALADIGVLVGVASKNDPDLVAEALRREDLVVPASALFPIEAHWGAKSGSVAAILKAWNIGAEDVVFVDDSRMERAEVAAAFPGMQCLAFPVGDDQKIIELVEELRNRFGKTKITEEDGLRVASLKASYERQASATATPEEFLRGAEGETTVLFDQPDGRAIDLINKTNQFNLNGRRIDEAAWKSRCEDPNGFLVTLAYQDKFGPLGKIAVVAGRREEAGPLVDVWVMSCRAFSRRIEHQALQALFDRLDVESIRFDFAPTDRNSPLQTFLSDVTGQQPDGLTAVHRDTFHERCPNLYAKLVVQ